MQNSYYFHLQPSEAAIFQGAANIYAGYVATGQVTPENEKEMVEKAISVSISIAQRVDELIKSDNEMTPGI